MLLVSKRRHNTQKKMGRLQAHIIQKPQRTLNHPLLQHVEMQKYKSEIQNQLVHQIQGPRISQRTSYSILSQNYFFVEFQPTLCLCVKFPINFHFVLYLIPDSTPEMKSHPHLHAMSIWLHLVPKLHTAGANNIFPAHNAFTGHDDPSLFTGVVRPSSFSHGYQVRKL